MKTSTHKKLHEFLWKNTWMPQEAHLLLVENLFFPPLPSSWGTHWIPLNSSSRPSWTPLPAQSLLYLRKKKKTEIKCHWMVVQEALTCQGPTCGSDSQLDLIKCDHSILSLENKGWQVFCLCVFMFMENLWRCIEEMSNPKAQDIHKLYLCVDMIYHILKEWGVLPTCLISVELQEYFLQPLQHRLAQARLFLTKSNLKYVFSG